MAEWMRQLDSTALRTQPWVIPSVSALQIREIDTMASQVLFLIPLTIYFFCKLQFVCRLEKAYAPSVQIHSNF